jgi:hypothetical protein
MMKVAEFIAALDLVGQVYRNKDGTEPADAIVEIVQQLSGAGDKTLAEWVAQKKARARPRARKTAKPVKAQPKIAAANISQPVRAEARTPQPKTSEGAIEAVATMLARAATQSALCSAIAATPLKAKEWQSLARKLTGKPGRSGKAARELIETHFSDQLLLRHRCETVRRQFATARR